MRVCILAEKTSTLFCALPHIQDMHPSLDVEAFALAFVSPHTHLYGQMRVPRGLTWSDYPYVGAPVYIPFGFGTTNREGNWDPRVRFDPELEPRLDVALDHPSYRSPSYWGWARREEPAPDAVPKAEARFRQANVIYVLTDPGGSYMHAMERALQHLDLGPDVEVRIPWFLDLSARSVRLSLENSCGRGDARITKCIAGSRTKRRFESCYHINALAVHGRTMRLAGASAEAWVPSKLGTQLMYLLRGRPPVRKQDLEHEMDTWGGTGCYPQSRGMGSYLGRRRVLELACEAGLVEVVESKRLMLSETGARFLDLLHPDSEDPNMTGRIDHWWDMPEAEANDRIDRYVKTFFGKQIRFLAKAARS